MEDEITTIEDLGALIKRTMASKEDIKELRTEMNQKFDEVGTQLDRIEHLLLAEQKREIEDLKQRMKRLEDALAV
jgi:L-2-hydroxyglutarate oxidase LhgO